MDRVIVTDHGRDRLVERFGCSVRKVAKLAAKAWRSREPVDARIVNAKRYTNLHPKAQYRQLMGTIFVFYARREEDGGVRATLVTVLTVRKKDIPGLEQKTAP